MKSASRSIQFCLRTRRSTRRSATWGLLRGCWTRYPRDDIRRRSLPGTREEAVVSVDRDSLSFGIKTGQSNLTYDEILRTWREADEVPVFEGASGFACDITHTCSLEHMFATAERL